LSSTPNPLSPNYVDVLSEEEDATPEMRATQEPEREPTVLQKATTFSLDPKGKTPMAPRDLEAEDEEKVLQIALRRSREDAQRRSMGGRGLRVGQ